ncbi:MAG: lysophospholipid acyltransferase family protein [Bosea sp. (in: a-proteobacteria)]
MIQIRSLVFNILFYINMIAWTILLLPTLLMPRIVFGRAAVLWVRSSFWLLKIICGTSYEIRGQEKLPSGGFLVGCKHQSMWETLALFLVFKDPAFVLKSELRWVPLYGWYTWKQGSIAINRKGGAATLASMNRQARAEAAAGRQIVIFPEGTRTTPGAPPAYKYGIVHMYDQMKVTCVPVGLNSGVFWPRRRFLRYPGTIVIEICEPIPPGLERDVFQSVLKERIETSSDQLLADAKAQLAA